MTRLQILVCCLAAVALGEESNSENGNKNKRSVYGEFPQAFVNPGVFPVIPTAPAQAFLPAPAAIPAVHPHPTWVKQVPVVVPVHRHVPVPVKVPVAVPVDRPYPVHVPVVKPVPVPVLKHVPVAVDRPVPVPVDRPYPVPVDRPVAVPVDRPYPVHVPVPVDRPVNVPQPVPVPQPFPVFVQPADGFGFPRTAAAFPSAPGLPALPPSGPVPQPAPQNPSSLGQLANLYATIRQQQLQEEAVAHGEAPAPQYPPYGRPEVELEALRQQRECDEYDAHHHHHAPPVAHYRQIRTYRHPRVLRKIVAHHHHHHPHSVVRITRSELD